MFTRVNVQTGHIWILPLILMKQGVFLGKGVSFMAESSVEKEQEKHTM